MRLAVCEGRMRSASSAVQQQTDQRRLRSARHGKPLEHTRRSSESGLAQLTDIHQDGVLLGLVEERRLDHPRVEAEPVADVELEELGGRRRQRRDACRERGILLEHADDVVGRELDQVGDRRRVEGGEGVEGEAPIR